MDIYDDEALRKPISFPPILKRLPTEIVHQIIEELPLRKILQILVHKDEFLDQCIISHLKLGKLFSDHAEIGKVLPLFIIYTEINRFLRNKAIPGVELPLQLDHLLAHASNTAVFRNEAINLRTYLTAAINRLLPVGEREMNMLEPHADAPIYCYSPELVVRWDWVKTAKRNLNRAKSHQLLLVADLMQKFPEKVMLKRPLDPSQGSPRQNLKHIEDRLRNDAKRALQHARLVYPIQNNTYRCKYTIELIPYDRYLWLFMDMLQKYPVAEKLHIDELVSNLTINSTPSGQRLAVYDYRPDVLEDIKLVLKGLKFVYTGNPLLVVRRIRYVVNGHFVRPFKPLFITFDELLLSQILT